MPLQQHTAHTWRSASRSKRDLILAVVVLAVGTSLCVSFDVFEALHRLSRDLETWEIDEAVPVIFLFAILSSWFAYRRWREAAGALAAQRQAEQEQAHLEDELRHAHKMEALGVFAGGISHEFNNLLLPVVSMTDLALQELPDESPLRLKLELANEAGRQSQDLVQQILAFSRKAEIELEPVDLRQSLQDGAKLVTALIPSNIEVSHDLPGNPCIVMAGQGQIQQILLNLASNAAHAIGDRPGEVAIMLSEVSAGEVPPAEDDADPDTRYAKITFKDNGPGLGEGTISRIFDPFFTTKSPGEGTGIGLSVVHGLVTKMRGRISVDSSGGTGTAFDIFLPIDTTEAANGARTDYRRSSVGTDIAAGVG